MTVDRSTTRRSASGPGARAGGRRCASCGPVLQAGAGLGDFRRVACVAEAHEPVPAGQVEVEARRRRHAQVVEPVVAQRHRPAGGIGQRGHVGVHVERTVGLGHLGDAGGGQALHQQGAVAGVALHVALELGGGIERRPARPPATPCGAQM